MYLIVKYYCLQTLKSFYVKNKIFFVFMKEKKLKTDISFFYQLI